MMLLINRVFEVSKYEEDTYFSNRIQSTLKPILDDVREAHKKDAETASDTSFKDFFLQRLDAVNCYDEDLAKSFITMTCKIHDIPLSVLSQEQKDALRSIMLKSRKYQAAVKQRKNSKKKKIGTHK